MRTSAGYSVPCLSDSGWSDTCARRVAKRVGMKRPHRGQGAQDDEIERPL